MGTCANCEAPVVGLDVYGVRWWVHPGPRSSSYSSRCEVPGEFAGLRAEPRA